MEKQQEKQILKRKGSRGFKSVKKLYDNKTGITLIALVITIIVLLILAGISISMLTGDNSILQQATNAKKNTIEGQEKEAISVAYSGVLTTTMGSRITAGDLQQELRKNGNNIEDIETVDEGMKVTFTDTHNVYIVGNSGSVNEYTLPKPTVANKRTPGGQAVQALSTSETTTLEDDDGNKLKVPQGFGIASDSATTITGGVVIEDVSYTDTAGSQYVWIPVFEYDEETCTWGADYSDVKNQTENSDDYYTAIETALKKYTATYKSAKYTDIWYGDASYGEYGYYDGSKFVYYTNGNMTSGEYTTLYHGMLKSVYENGGFYIGRYEMGIKVVNSTDEAKNATRVKVEEYTPSTQTWGRTLDTAAAVSIAGMSKPLSKTNAVAYTYITQSQAEMLAESLNYSGVISSLLFGVQWDAVCVYLEHFGVIDKSAITSAEEPFNASYLKNNTYSKLWGNYKSATFKMDRGYYSTTYSNTTAVTWIEKSANAKETSTSWLCTTGASDQNQACNIYDFAGNLPEWTLEKSNVENTELNPCVARGSDLSYSYYASYRDYYGTKAGSCRISARPSLYIR